MPSRVRHTEACIICKIGTHKKFATLAGLRESVSWHAHINSTANFFQTNICKLGLSATATKLLCTKLLWHLGNGGQEKNTPFARTSSIQFFERD